MRKFNYLGPQLLVLAILVLTGCQSSGNSTSTSENIAPNLANSSRSEIYARANHLSNQHRHREAKPYWERAIELETAAGGKVGNRTVLARLGLGFTHMAQRQFSDAETVLSHLIGDIQDSFGENTARSATALALLATVKISQKQYKAGERLASQGLRNAEAQLGGSHPSLRINLTALAKSKIGLGKYSEAEKLLVRAEKIQKLPGVRQNTSTAKSIERLLILVRTKLGVYN